MKKRGVRLDSCVDLSSVSDPFCQNVHVLIYIESRSRNSVRLCLSLRDLRINFVNVGNY